MLITLDSLVNLYNLKIKGILHVGAHLCEEIHHYEKYVQRNKILWIEAIPEKTQMSKKMYNNLLIENAVVSDVVETVKFNVSSNYQSSSFLELGLHSHYHPEIHYTSSFEAETKLLKDIICNYDIEYNFINLDIQGAELKALKGMEEYLNKVDYLYTEVNSDYVYKGCCLITELDEYLLKFGLHRVETKWTDCRWGDAFYIRK